MFYPDLLYSVYIFGIMMICPINMYKFKEKIDIFLNNPEFKGKNHKGN